MSNLNRRFESLTSLTPDGVFYLLPSLPKGTTVASFLREKAVQTTLTNPIDTTHKKFTTRARFELARNHNPHDDDLMRDSFAKRW